MSSDSASSEEPDLPEAAPASPDYVPGPEEPEQAPLSPDYVSGPEYPEYLAPSDEEVPMEDQPYDVTDSPIALSPGYVADSDPKKDLEEDSEDGPVDYPADGGDGDNDESSDDDKEEEEDFEEEDVEEEEEEHLALADSVVAPIIDHVPSSEETEPFKTDESAATPPSPPACRTTARIYIQPKAPIPFPLEEEVERLLALPPPLPSPLISLSPPSAEERLARPAGGHGIDYGFIGTLDAETRRQRAEEVGYGIRDTWVNPREATEEIALVALEGVNTRVTELAAVQEQDTQDIYAVIEDAQDRQNRIFQRIQDPRLDARSQYRWARFIDSGSDRIGFITAGTFAMALGEIRALQARDQACADAPEGTASTAVGLVFSFLVSDNHNNMPPKKTSGAARAVVVAAPMTVDVEQLIEARVFEALANHETLQNNINGHGNESYNSDPGIRGTVRTPYTKEDMMTVKYYPRGKIKNLEIELWNLKVKGTDIASYTLRFQELALMCGRMFHEESEEVEKYVGGLPDMIRGNDNSNAVTCYDVVLRAHQERLPKLKNGNRVSTWGNGKSTSDKVFMWWQIEQNQTQQTSLRYVPSKTIRDASYLI
ncbi:hypothetical protein Tco_0381084 [Tanacetum coccineum]